MMIPLFLDQQTAALVASFFRALSDTSRVRILSAIVQREFSIQRLSETIGITTSAVSHHMRTLRQMKLVKYRRDGKEVFYRVDDPRLVALFQLGVNHIQNL